MPKADIRYTERARRDLSSIYQQRLSQRGSEGSDGARAHVQSIVATIATLAEYPERGPVPPELEALGERKWRQVSHPPYRVIYRLDDNAVIVALVADSRRDFAYLLQRRLLSR
ncbi:MAG: hypothetical protein RIS85_1524 [Pseudomonadota bacterium]